MTHQGHQRAALLALLLGAFPAWAGTIEFAAVPVPVADAEMRQVVSTTAAVVDGKTARIGFHIIMRSGDVVGGATYGRIVDRNGNALLAQDGSPIVSNDTDFSSLLPGAGRSVFMVSHFESIPAAMYLTELEQGAAGELVAMRTRALDFSSVQGGWAHCAGSVTPWGTHLGAEEYEPDARKWRDSTVVGADAEMARYFAAAPEAAASVLNPYRYGYPVEVAVRDFADASVHKRYAMGRASFELAYAMPDQRTVYMSDDGIAVGLFRFVADRKGDLSAGTLWAARWQQRSGKGLGTARIDWISLGHASETDVAEWIDQYRFADIFDEADPVGGACEAGFRSIIATRHQCLRLRDVNRDGTIDEQDETIAAHLETRRWAALAGATTEWNKMEGITFNPDANQLYIAMSDIANGMENLGGPDRGGPNHIRLEQNRCGGVYALDVDGNYTAIRMAGLVAGIPRTYAAGDPLAGNTCDVDGIANPDNITYLPGYKTLIIGEDTGPGHRNDAIWSYALDTGKLTRLLTTPYGAESTSIYFYPDINGHAYIMAVVQHPYGESDSGKLENPDQARAITGYLGPLPRMAGGTERDH